MCRQALPTPSGFLEVAVKTAWWQDSGLGIL